MFLKDKYNGDIKGQAWSDGTKQQEMINKEEKASPTDTTEIILITAAADENEGRNVTWFDTLGAYLHTEME